MKILDAPGNRLGGLRFEELYAKLRDLPKTERIGSPNTLSDTLKTLCLKGVVEHDIETRRYRVPDGMPKALTDELGRRSLASEIGRSDEFAVLHDVFNERGKMHCFVDRFTQGRGVNALVWEAHDAFDDMSGHVTRGILDLARSHNLFDEGYFERTLDPAGITNDQLDKIWTDLKLRKKKMFLTYEVDSEKLLEFLKSNAGKNFLKRAFDDFSRLQKQESFHKRLNVRLYLDAYTQRGKARISLPWKSEAKEGQQ